MDWKMCTVCGLVIYTPRPSEDDLRRKYEFLVSLGSDAEQNLNHSVLDKRVKQLFREATKYFSGGGMHVLDYGGGSGLMLKPFLEAGWKCSIIDYLPCVVEGVEKFGNTVESLPKSSKFDLIICSHVLEHLAYPRQILGRLVEHLAPKGQLYLEVPLEIWRRAPNPEEVVTHINYFTPSSLQSIASRAGLYARIRIGWAYHTVSGYIRVIRAWCKKATANKAGRRFPIAPDTFRFLNPGLGLRLRIFFSRPDWFERALSRFVRRKRG